MQNQFRQMYAMTKFSAQNILSYQDQIDLHRDVLNGADAHIVEQLEADLSALQQQVARCTNTFKNAREAAIKAFLGPLEEAAFAAHQARMDNLLQSCNIWVTGSLTQGQKPTYDAVPTQTSTAAGPSGSTLTDTRPSPPPSYVSLFPRKSTAEFQAVPHPDNTRAEECHDLGSLTSDGHNIDHLALLERLIRKLIEELWELINQPIASPPDPASVYTPTQQAYHRSNTQLFTPLPPITNQARTPRATFLRDQLCALVEILREEVLIKKYYHDCLGLIARLQSDRQASRRNVRDVQGGFIAFVDAVYRVRASNGVSELLVPLNGTDSSIAHSIRLLPPNDVQFPPCVAGFPAYVTGQWESYSGSVTRNEVRSLYYEGAFPGEGSILMGWDAERFVEKTLTDYNATKESVGRALTEEALRRHDGRSHSVPSTIGSSTAASGVPSPTTSFAGQMPQSTTDTGTRMNAGTVALQMRHLPATMAPPYPTVLKAPPGVSSPGYLEYHVVFPSLDDDDYNEDSYFYTPPGELQIGVPWEPQV